MATASSFSYSAMTNAITRTALFLCFLANSEREMSRPTASTSRDKKRFVRL
jgi:hypothetical protein